ncbi:MAG: hypothetical protein GF401_03390 [Chitinivibrionales bacterium]|nr:hypothetical protein [Chitinivibrionales bacterium]
MKEKKELAATPFVLFCGDDTISKEQIRSALIEKVTTLHGSCTKELFDPTSETVLNFIEKIMTPSLFNDIRIFQINHLERLSSDDLQQISRLLDYPIDNVYLFMDAGTFSDNRTSQAKKWKNWVKAYKDKVSSNSAVYSCFEFMKPPDYKISEWLTTNVPFFFGRTIAKDCAEHLIDLTGTDLGALYSELQKIDLNIAPKKAIDRDSIDQIVGVSRTTQPYELANALGTKDMKRTMEIIDGLFASAFYAPVCISAIFKHFWALYRIRKYAEQNPDQARMLLNPGRNFNMKKQNELALRFGVAAGLLGENQLNKVYPVIIKPRLVHQARAFKENHHKKIFGWLQEFDIGSKTGKIDPNKKAFELLCYKIIRVEELEKAA